MPAVHDPRLNFFGGSASRLRRPSLFYLSKRGDTIADMPLKQITHLLFHRPVVLPRDGL
jgi:hypothetical protein